MQCKAVKKDGTQCGGVASGPSGLCWAHNPQNQEKRRINASLGGKARNGEVHEIKAEIKRIVKDVENGKIKTNVAQIMIQGLGSLRYFIELERRVREDEEFAARLDALEADASDGSPRERAS
jgi:hypothetical protein